VTQLSTEEVKALTSIRKSSLAQLFLNHEIAPQDSDGRIFVDIDPGFFNEILDYVSSGRVKYETYPEYDRQ
jgi:hypothetical protein